MKPLTLALLALSLPLASCRSVSIPLEPPAPSVPVTFHTKEASSSGILEVAPAHELRQGRNPGASKIPEEKDRIDTPPRVWELMILAGYRNMSAGAWNELENQGVIGVEAAIYPTALSFLGAEVGLQGSYSRDGERSAIGDSYNLDGSVGEIYGGLRTRGHFGRTRWRHASGIGVGLIRADREDVVNGVVERGNDVSLTFYLHILVAFDISPGVYFGVDLRSDFGSTMTINGNKGSANYLQGALALGFDL